MEEKVANDAMQLILHAGNAKSMMMEAMYEVIDNRNYKKAQDRIKEAGKELGKAHEIQTALLFDEMQGKQENSGAMSILMVHAQDHYMNAVMLKDFAELMILEMIKNDAR